MAEYKAGIVAVWSFLHRYSIMLVQLHSLSAIVYSLAPYFRPSILSDRPQFTGWCSRTNLSRRPISTLDTLGHLLRCCYQFRANSHRHCVVCRTILVNVDYHKTGIKRIPVDVLTNYLAPRLLTYMYPNGSLLIHFPFSYIRKPRGNKRMAAPAGTHPPFFCPFHYHPLADYNQGRSPGVATGPDDE